MKIGKNQYIIVPNGFEYDFEYKHTIALGSYLALLGDRCDYTYAEHNDYKCLLLGYAIDAEKPERDIDEMLAAMLGSLKADATNIADITLYWGGRWSVFLLRGNSLIAFNDACGLKQLFYSSNIFGSQSRYVAQAVRAKVEPQADNYIREAMRIDKEYSWPLSKTLFTNVYRLLPNHVYCEGRVKRISTTDRFISLNYTERIQAVSRLLRNAMIAANKYKRMAVTLTAGWDSRLVLVACEDVRKSIDVVTLKYTHISDSHIDVQIPKELCTNYGYNHVLLTCKPVDTEFAEEYKQHSENAHDYWIQMTQSVKDYGYQDWLWTKGSCNEISRNSSGVLYDWQITSNVLSKLYGIVANAYSKTILDNWLVEAKTYAKTSGYSLLDLFFWEQRLGSWLAECLNEADVVGETFTPFNIRAYFEIIKDVPVKYRVSPKYSFFEDVLNACGMDLDIPVNPNRYSSFRSKTKCLIKNKLHLLYGLILNA